MGKLITVGILCIALVVCWEILFSYPPFDPNAIRGQRVLITGSSTGIGEQLAYQYAKMGASLIITARSEYLLKEVATRCEKLGAQQVHFVAADMANPKDRSRVVVDVEEHLGGLDQLILNHAIFDYAWWVESMTNVTLFEHVLHVNFFSYTDLASRTLPMLMASRGRIGVVSSIFGEMPAIMFSMYNTCKFALHGSFSSLRQELRHNNTGVSVTFVVLGLVKTDNVAQITAEITPHIPKKSMATPFDAARAILESVFQRRYRYAFDWKYRYFLVMSSYFPQSMEDLMAQLFMNDVRHRIVRFILFVSSYLYAD